jgi:hypothetical protein
VKPTFVIYGNCQAGVLQDILKSAPAVADNYELVYYQSFNHPTDGVATIESDVMARCALLWSQSDENSPFHFNGTTPEGMRTITFPSVDIGVLWPFQANDPLFGFEERYPFGMFPYGDRMLMKVAEQGRSGAEGLASLVKAWDENPFPFERYLDIEMLRLVKREQSTQVKLAAYVLAHFRTDRLLWSYNHPTRKMFSVLLNRLIAATFPESRDPAHDLHCLGDRLFSEYDPFAASYQAPILPPVAQALDLQWWSADDRYYFHHDEYLNWTEFVERYLSNRIARQQAIG